MSIKYITPKPLQRELADSIIKCANLDDLRILVATGAKVNDSVTQGLKPIHYAVWQQYREAVHFLLVRGCDVNSTDDCGYSPLHLAAEHGYVEMMSLLLAYGAKTDYRKDDGVLFPRTTLSDEPLRLAIKNGHYDAAKMLLDHGANVNARYFTGSELNLLHPLDTKFIKLLLSYGANIESVDRFGLTFLMKAVRNASALESVSTLIAHGADVNAKTDERHDFRTVLHYGVLSGNIEIIQLLIRNGAKVDFGTEYQKPTPLDLAILKGDPEIVKILINAGANANGSSPIIGSPLHVASSDNISNRVPILTTLLESGADVNIIIKSEDGTPLKSILAEYLSSNEDIDEKTIDLFLAFGARVIFKSQFRDPLGILNYLGNAAKNKVILRKLLESAESFDPTMIKRCNALTTEEKNYALFMTRNPKSLKKQARDFIRKFTGSKLSKIVHELFLPKVLQDYVLNLVY